MQLLLGSCIALERWQLKSEWWEWPSDGNGMMRKLEKDGEGWSRGKRAAGLPLSDEKARGMGWKMTGGSYTAPPQGSLCVMMQISVTLERKKMYLILPTLWGYFIKVFLMPLLAEGSTNRDLFLFYHATVISSLAGMHPLSETEPYLRSWYHLLHLLQSLPNSSGDLGL